MQHLQIFSFLYNLQENALGTSENREVPSFVNSAREAEILDRAPH